MSFENPSCIHQELIGEISCSAIDVNQTNFDNTFDKSTEVTSQLARDDFTYFIWHRVSPSTQVELGSLSLPSAHIFCNQERDQVIHQLHDGAM